MIHYTKSIFARHGIPREVESDNGPQYSSYEYRKFSEDWNFRHTTTSPYHPQAEQAVQTTHNLLTKAKEMEKIHTWVFWSTGTLQSTISQAQMLMSRRLRSTIPTTKSQLQPRLIEERSPRRFRRSVILTEVPRNYKTFIKKRKFELDKATNGTM